MWFDIEKHEASPTGFASVRFNGADVEDCRRQVHADDLLILEDSARSASNPLGHGYSSDHQIVLPYFGAFTWKIGRSERLVDTNGVLLVTGRQEFYEAHPTDRFGHGSGILTPSLELVEELASRAGRSAADLFPTQYRPVTNNVRLATHRLLFGRWLSPLEYDEQLLLLLAGMISAPLQKNDPLIRRVVERAKAVLHEHSYHKLSLGEVARLVGVSPIYLTQSFSKCEGIPLGRYQMRLRLARALIELPQRRSLTELALDLGFSSHAHFSSAFRGAYGITPSSFRADHRC